MFMMYEHGGNDLVIRACIGNETNMEELQYQILK